MNSSDQLLSVHSSSNKMEMIGRGREREKGEKRREEEKVGGRIKVFQ